MFKIIKPDNDILMSQEFQKDKYKFNLIFKNLSSPELELYSDEENYIFCRGSKNLPTWIWTKNNLDNSKIEEIEELIKKYLTDNDKDKFTCKKELYDLLLERNFENLNKDDYFEMGFLICHKTKAPKKCDGTLSNEVLGNDTDKKWSDLWYIYQPYGYDKTLAQMTDEERANRIKYDSVDSMVEFSKWYKNQKQ